MSTAPNEPSLAVQQLQIARLFSTGRFEAAAAWFAEDIEFHMFEDAKHLAGKAEVMAFCAGIAAYFDSVETDFREHGHLVTGNQVAIYGYAEFKREGKVVNAVHSCDVYVFNDRVQLVTVYAYCNSQQQPTS